MTAQVGDSYSYQGENYSIIAMSVPMTFLPQKYGMVPSPRCTACWNGYWCEYEISEEGMILKNLFIHTENDYYPEVNGVSVCKKKNQEKKDFSYMGHHKYENINLPMEYTGKIVVGSGFLREYYIHMGYQRAWAYEKVFELCFENGKLISKEDHSKIVAKVREEAKQDPQEFRKKIYKDPQEFVEESFSLEWKDKCWWLV